MRKICGIPPTFLVAILISAGIACATFVVVTVITATEISEPITVSETQEFNATMDPGAYNTWQFDVKNNSSTVNYNISYHVTDGVTDEKKVSVTTFEVCATDHLSDLKGDDGVVGPGDEYISTINAGATETVILKIYADTDAPAPQLVDIAIAVGRE